MPSARSSGGVDIASERVLILDGALASPNRVAWVRRFASGHRYWLAGGTVLNRGSSSPYDLPLASLPFLRKASGVVVHRCRSCGVWLDGTNAATFFALFEQGHFVELEERATQSTHDDLEARIAKLETAHRQDSSVALTMSPGMTHAQHSGFLIGNLLGFLASLLDG